MTTKTEGYLKGKVYRVNQQGHEWDGMVASLEWRHGADAWVMRGKELRKVKLACLSSKNVIATSVTDTEDRLDWEDEEQVAANVQVGRVNWLRAAVLWVMGYWRQSAAAAAAAVQIEREKGNG